MINASLRKSYKSIINWGRNSLSFKLVDINNPDEAIFKSFKELHLLSSGRKTRSDQTWDIQFQMIKSGWGYLASCYMNNQMVSGCIIMNDSNLAYYAVAASNREMMANKLPLNHFPLFQSILIAKEKGCKKFIMGKINTDFSDFDNLKNTKDDNISKFKLGFSSHIDIFKTTTFRFGN